MEMEEKVSSVTVANGKSDLLADETLPKARKPYTITKQREKWTEEEHKKFLEALQLHGRNWRRIEEHIGTKTTIQIRSHAQKFFSKVVRESSKSNNTSNVTPIHIPPPRPKRKPTRPYPRKLGSVGSGKQSIAALKKPDKPSLKEMVVDQQENGSPTSVLSTVASESAGSGSPTVLNGCASPVGSVVGSNEQYNVAQLSGSSGDEQNRCTSPQMAITDSTGKLPSPEESAQRSEVHTCATPEEEMCVESFSPSLKLFGKTVAVKAVSSQKNNTGNTFSDENMAIDRENNPIGFLPNEATWNSWHSGMLPFFYYMPPLPGENISPVGAHFPLWSPYGVVSYPQVNPEAGNPDAQCLNLDDTVSREMRRLGSFTGSSSVSNGDLNECQNVDPVESGKSIKKIDSLVISSSKECDDKPVRGFVPYKRCIVETQKIKATAEDGESELTRLCL